MNISLSLKRKPYIMAHRGSSMMQGENTLDAFRQAATDGADIVETDLRVTSDGKFVCMHDRSVARTSKGKGIVEEMSFADLRNLNVTGDRSGGSVAHIPTLDDLAAVLPADVIIALELKSSRFDEKDLCRDLVAEMDRAGIRQRSIVISFRRSHLTALRSVGPDIPVGLVGHKGLLPPRDFQLVGPHWITLLMNPMYASIAHRRGQFVCPLDPHPERLLKWYLMVGCDALLTDDPAGTRKRIEHVRTRKKNKLLPSKK